MSDLRPFADSMAGGVDSESCLSVHTFFLQMRAGALLLFAFALLFINAAPSTGCGPLSEQACSYAVAPDAS